MICFQLPVIMYHRKSDREITLFLNKKHTEGKVQLDEVTVPLCHFINFADGISTEAMKQEIDPNSTKRAISFQFHHAQMDGCQATRFLEALQNAFNTI